MAILSAKEIHQAALEHYTYQYPYSARELLEREMRSIVENIYREAGKGQFGIMHVFSLSIMEQPRNELTRIMIRKKLQNLHYTVSFSDDKEVLYITW